MDADIDVPEEGEIVDDCDHYTPLPRPTNYAAQTTISSSSCSQSQPHFPTQESESDDEVESSSGSDDSDTMGQKVAKRPRFKPRPRAASASNAYPRKYNVWSSRAQEDLLLENLINCDVSRVDRSRTVETYPVLRRTTNKRSMRDRNDSTLKPMRWDAERAAEVAREEDACRGAARTLLDLACTAEDSEEVIARDIANKLFEEKQDLIERVVRVAGKEKTFSIYKDVKRIEAEGGMLIMNQTRRRTPGGVFLFFIKHDNDLTREQLNNIFIDDRLKAKLETQTKKRQRSQAMKLRLGKSKEGANLPELLTRAELCTRKVVEESRCGEGQEAPPPSPVTDCHENSTDGMESLNGTTSDTCENPRKLNSYGDDFLDVGCGTDMDLF